MSLLSEAQKIVVTGGGGFLGRHVVVELTRSGVHPDRMLVPRSRTHDLRKPEVCADVVRGADIVIHLAAKVGGIGFNQRHPGELFLDNALMGINLIEAARVAGVRKVVVAGTVCAYPRHTPVPFREEDIWNGYPEETNAPYGVAKKSLLVMLQAYRQQYGLDGIFLLPVNLYGPYDNFDLESSHVIPALIRKFSSAKESGADSVTVWGDGSPTREFLFVEDAARGIVAATERYDGPDPINLGTSEEVSIATLAETIKAAVGFRGKIIWDTSRPNGQERRKLDTSKARERFGFEAKVHLSEGLERTVAWWAAHSR